MQGEENLSRRVREKIAHRQEILEAAKRLFARKGFHAATVDEIAQEADFSKGAMYVHFANKEDLFLSLIQEKTEELGERLEEVVHSTDDLENKVRTFVKTYLDAFDEDKEFFQIIAAERPRLTAQTQDRLQLRLRERYLETLRLVDEMMQEGIHQGRLRQTEPRFLGITLLGIIHSFTAQWLLLGRKDPLSRMESLIVELFLGGARV
jgi:AcrR family transcriptional regulator